MSGIVAFDDLFPLKADPTTLDRVFGFDSEDGKSRGFTIQSILDLIAETPVTWAEIEGKPTTFAPAAHSLGSHSNVDAAVDTAPDGRLLKRIGGVWAPWTPDFLTSETDPTVPAWVKAITEAEKANWNSAFGWRNHAGQYRPISWVPAWGDVTGKPATFAPSAHSLASHSDAAALAAATEGQLVRKAAIGFEAFTAPYLTSEADPIFTAHPAYGITLGAIASWNEKLTEWAAFPNNTIPMIKDGAPVASGITGVWSENPFDPETESEDYEAWVTELLHLISTKRIKGPDGVDADDYVTKGQLDAAGSGLPPGGTTGQVLTKQSAADGDADWETPSGGGSPTPYLTDLDTWPVLKFDKNYRYTHEMAGAVEISAEFLIPVALEGNFCKLYIKADGTNKPTFTGDFTVIWDNWVNTAGHWNRFYAEYSPEGKVILQIEQAHLGSANDGSGLTQLTITFEANHVQSHVITNSTEIVIDSLGAEEGYQTILYVKADGVNKPFWDSADVTVTYDDYLNEADIWNRIVLEWRPESKAIMQLINT